MKITIPRVLALLAAAALAAYVFVVAPSLPASTAKQGSKDSSLASALHRAGKAPAENVGVFPAAGKKFIGIMTTTGAYNFTDLDKFTRAVGHSPEVYEFSQGWGVNNFNRGIIEAVAKRGMLPVISWEPWDYRREPKPYLLHGYQPAYALSQIIDGRYDSYIRSWAEGVKGLRFTIGIRFAHEMNSFWYPWGVFANGNRMRQYVRAWRHVHDIFAQIGATNVIWIWSPNIIWNNFTDLAKLYPGDAYVTWIGLSGYYGSPGMTNYMTFNTVFDRTIDELRTFTNKPLVITETGATNTSGLMARWVTQMFKELPAHPNIIGVIWYEGFNVIDWRIADDPAAAAAFKAGFASSHYRVSWVPGMTPTGST
jgi:mannan endo-1,4-beta-mannosidase